MMRVVVRQIIRQKVPRGSTIYSDGFRSYALLLTDSDLHCLILHTQMLIENFWSFKRPNYGAMSASDGATLSATEGDGVSIQPPT